MTAASVCFRKRCRCDKIAKLLYPTDIDKKMRDAALGEVANAGARAARLQSCAETAPERST
jgi:hypothetical protein